MAEKKSPLIEELLAFIIDLRDAFGWRLPLLLALMAVVALGEGVSHYTAEDSASR